MSTSPSTALKTDSYPPEHGSDPALPAWKLELNAKLAAHRQRRPSSGSGESDGHAEPMPERRGDGAARAASVAARVAERYAKAPSYSEFLAASAAAAAAAAETAAFAARQAQEAAEVFVRLSAEQPAPEWTVSQDREDRGLAATGGWEAAGPPRPSAPGTEQRRIAELKTTIEHPEPLPPRGIIPSRPASPSLGAGIVDAFAEATVSPAVSLPAKLIQFPRELIAAHKARARIAEGPLCEEAESRSLRIFEVGDGEGAARADGDFRKMGADCEPTARLIEPASRRSEENGWRESSAYQPERESGRKSEPGSGPGEETSSVSHAHSILDRLALDRLSHAVRPSEEVERRAPEWHSIRLGEHPAPASWTGSLKNEPHTDGRKAGQTDVVRLSGMPVLQAASIGDRTMAVLVDATIVGAAFLLFVLTFAACTTHPSVNKTALACGAAVLGLLFLLYEWLFMSYGGGTLGMRYARIALCTFEDDNPTRTGRRRRVAASILSALPLGLGFLWALFDEDRLGWHDRMSRSYQRSYR